MADILSAADIHSAPVVNSGFNGSYFYGMYDWTKRVVTLPSRVFERIHLLEELLQEDPHQQAESMAAAAREGRSDVPFRRSMNRASGAAIPLPGPWGFFVSRYAVVVVILLFVLNRIHHVVAPSRNARRRSRRSGLFSIFPLNMASTRTRLAFRAPTIAMLLRAYILWMVVTMQTAGFFPEWSILKPLGDKARKLPMDELCWTTFLAITVTLVGNTIGRGLEGNATGYPTTRPFNIAGYAFMMYLYSQPISHVNNPGNGASRPDKHILIMVSMPLLEMTLIHLLGVKRRWGRKRLYPTAFCSALNLLHYHYVLWISDTPYPLISFFHGAIETGLIAVIIITVGLRAFAQLATSGEVRGPLIGHAATWTLRTDEDFNLALLRLGTAALDATVVAGLENEVGAVGELPRAADPVVAINAVDAAVEGGRRTGFGNEVKTIRAKTAAESDPARHGAYYRETTLFGLAALRCANGLFQYLSSFVRRHPVPTLRPTDDAQLTAPAPRPRWLRLEDENALYDRFRQGEVEDDENDEWMPMEPITSASPSDDSEEEDFEAIDDDDGVEEPDTDETPQLYEELTAHPTSTPVMLAHLSNTSTSPLTRLRYRRIAAGHTEEESSWIQQRREAAIANAGPRDEFDEARRRACVVCTVDERSIILWPCRCLALCEDCRGNLASRSSASKHSCPCCRQHVDGYSRIYVP